MVMISSDRFNLGPVELTSKLRELRFDDLEEAGVRSYSSGLEKKLRLEIKMMPDIDLLKLKKLLFECQLLIPWSTTTTTQTQIPTHFHFISSSPESNGFTVLHIAFNSLCVKWQKRKSRFHLTNTCFDAATTVKSEFCVDLNAAKYLRLQNFKDFEGSTALHLSTSTNLHQTLRVLPRNELADVNALNSGGFKALDIPCDIPNSENMDVKFDMTRPEESGARACDLTNQRIEHNDDCSPRGLSNSCDLSNQKIKHNKDYSHGWLSNRSSVISIVKSIITSRNVLLLIATLFTTITYQVPFHLHGSASKEGYTYISGTFQKNEQHSILSNSFLLFNSIVFIASVVMTLFLLHEFPFKPWPQISILALFGSYLCSIKAISPNGALALLFISILFSLLATAGKLYSFARHNFT